jgi:hypothetical protein
LLLATIAFECFELAGQIDFDPGWEYKQIRRGRYAVYHALKGAGSRSAKTCTAKESPGEGGQNPER